jgi:multiple sugar transport system permease protein
VFLTSARNTAYFVLIGVPLTLGLALAAAVALDRGITRLRSLFRLGFYLPVIT